MLIGFLYQTTNGDFYKVNLRAVLSKYITQTETAIAHQKDFVCAWRIKVRY